MADVKTNAFMLSGATVMLGRALIDDVFALTPEKHSVGMVSEINISLSSSINELLNGTAQTPVDGRRTGLSTSITGNIFEMTARNFMRSQGIIAAPTPMRRGRIVTEVTVNSTSVSFVSNPVPGEGESAFTGISDLPIGSTLLLQRPDGETDYVLPAKTTGAAVQNGPMYTVPILTTADMTFPVGSRLWMVEPVPVGDIGADDLFCVKIAGVLSNFDRPVVYVAPKVRMVKGFGISFNETQYSSMNWEMKALLLSRGEVSSLPRLREVGLRRTGQLLVGGGSDATGYVPPLPTPDPTFSSAPSISPNAGTAGTTQFTATDATINNGVFAGRRWLLDGALIGVGQTITPASAGQLRLETKATGNGITITTLSPAVTVQAAPIVTPAPSFTTAPTITASDSTPQVGEGLTGNSGTVSNGTVASVRWLRGTTVVATTAQYTPTIAGGHRFEVTATGAGGTTVAGVDIVVGAAAGVATISNTLSNSTLLPSEVQGAVDLFNAREARVVALEQQAGITPVSKLDLTKSIAWNESNFEARITALENAASNPNPQPSAGWTADDGTITADGGDWTADGGTSGSVAPQPGAITLALSAAQSTPEGNPGTVTPITLALSGAQSTPEGNPVTPITLALSAAQSTPEGTPSTVTPITLALSGAQSTPEGTPSTVTPITLALSAAQSTPEGTPTAGISLALSGAQSTREGNPITLALSAAQSTPEGS